MNEKKNEKKRIQKKREKRYRVIYLRECWLLSKEVYTRSTRTIEQSHGTGSYFLIESLEVNNFFFVVHGINIFQTSFVHT